MRRIMLLAVAAFATSIFAEQVEKRRATSEEREARKAKFHEIQMRKNGGIVIKPGSQQGNVLIANVQKRVTGAVFEMVAKQISKELRIGVKVETAVLDVTAETAANAAASMNAQLTIFVVDQPGNATTLLIAPEGRWGIVNVAPLAAGTTGDALTGRVHKEVSRAFAMLAGAATSQYQGSIMSPILRPSDLDGKAELRLPYDVQSRLWAALPSFGITPYVQANYRKACQEGWAPAPTNDFQKAIWNEVHKLPEKPIKIEFDPAKGK